MNREVKKGQIYRHFKGNLYEVMGIATHTETEEELVIYRPCDSDNDQVRSFARPLDMFLSEVDHVKYPDVKAKYRFTLVTWEDREDSEDTDNLDDSKNSSEGTVLNDDSASVGSEGYLDEQLEKLLDAKSYGEKAELLYALRDRLTKEMIRTICITHDIELNSTDIMDQYEELKSYMLTMEKYESTRLR